MKKSTIGQIFSYLAALALLWVLVGQIIQVNLTTDKLIKVSGIVDRKLEAWNTAKKKELELRIYLKGKPDYFRFMHVYNYDKFSYQINPGDSVEIFVRPKWLVSLGLGYKNDIFQMSSNGETIFEIADTKKNNMGIIVVVALGIPAFILLAQYIRRKQKNSPSLT